MRQDYTHITFIMDRSGSMACIANDAVGGYNTFIEEQKKLPGKATFSLIWFDHEYEKIHEFVDIQNVQPLQNYSPRGSTALYDAMARAMVSTGEKLAAMQEQDRPSKVVIVVLTDGQENASREYRLNQIQEMIKHQTGVYNWQMIYLSADINAIQDAQVFGFSANNAFQFKNSGKGTKSTYSLMSRAISSYRGSSNPDAQVDVLSCYDADVDQDVIAPTVTPTPNSNVTN